MSTLRNRIVAELDFKACLKTFCWTVLPVLLIIGLGFSWLAGIATLANYSGPHQWLAGIAGLLLIFGGIFLVFALDRANKRAESGGSE
jgi:hypothetical protein